MIEKSQEVYNEHTKKFPNIIMLGAPGAGKGSIATKWCKIMIMFKFQLGTCLDKKLKIKLPLA